MKLLFLGFVVISSSFTSCNNNADKSGNKVTLDTGTVSKQTDQVVQNDSASIQAVLTEYLRLKNALVGDKSKEAAEAARSLKNVLDSLGGELMTVAQQTAFSDIGDDSKEHAEHISANAGNIKHQREHFQLLSKDIYDLVKAFGTTQTIYKDYCPMVKAIWLSETRPIKNPYYGSSMLTCGQVQETIQK